MSPTALIIIALIAIIVAMLPGWKYSRLWGGGYAPSIFVACILGAHLYTSFF